MLPWVCCRCACSITLCTESKTLDLAQNEQMFSFQYVNQDIFNLNSSKLAFGHFVTGFHTLLKPQNGLSGVTDYIYSFIGQKRSKRANISEQSRQQLSSDDGAY